MTERWLPVVGYEDRALVSDLGRVRTIPHIDAQGHQQRGCMLRQSLSTRRKSPSSSRLKVRLVQKSHYVHTLVLKAFRGPRPLGMEGCHNDGDHLNNRLSNLRWDTHQANMDDMAKHGRDPKGERNWKAKLTEEQVRHMRYLRSAYGTKFSELAALVGSSVSVVHAAIRGINWKHIPLLPSEAK